MSDLWAGVLLGVVFSVPIGIGVNLFSSYIQRKYRNRSIDARMRDFQLRSEEERFANYLARNPVVASIVWANYRTRIAKILLRNGVLATLILLVGYTLNQTLIGLAVYGVDSEWIVLCVILLLATLWPLVLTARSLARVVPRARRIAGHVDVAFPISTDLSDAKWREFQA